MDNRVHITDFKRIADHIEDNHELLLERFYPSEAGGKKERFFYVSEVADLLGISVNHTHRILKKHSNLNEELEKSGDWKFFVDKDSKGRKCIDLENLFLIRVLMNELEPGKGYLPLKPADGLADIIAITHLKGGSAKTQTSVSFAQHCATMGYRVLVVDADPQASLTIALGLVPERDVQDGDTLMLYFHGEEVTLDYAIQKTYWHNLDLIPTNLEVYDLERVMPYRQFQSVENNQKYSYWQTLKNGLDTVRDKYDIIVIDSSPSFSFMLTNVIYAADAIVVPTPAEFFDYSALGSLFRQINNTFEVLSVAEGQPFEVDFVKILITKYRAISAQNAMINIMQDVFGSMLMQNKMVYTDAIAKSNLRLKTPYELSPYDLNRETYKRAFNSAKAVNNEILETITSNWDGQMELV